MATVDDQLVMVYSTHHVYLGRLQAQFGNEVIPYLTNIENGMYAILGRYKSKTMLTPKIRAEIQKEINELTRTELKAYTTQYKQNNKEMAENESIFNAKTLTGLMADYSATIPTAAAISKVVRTTPFNLGDGTFTSYQKYVNAYHEQWSSKIDNAVRAGMLPGGSIASITKDIMAQMEVQGRKALASAKTMARTGTSFYSNQATKAFVDVNDEVLRGYRFLATLDSRTSKQCRSLDQTTYAKDADNIPRLPLHPNERSTLIYDVDPRFKYDDSEATRAEAFINPKTGKRKVDFVSSQQTYYESLKDQSDAVQNSILGKTLADAFRELDNPELFAKSLIDSTYKPYTMEQLRDKDNKLAKILKKQSKTKE